MMLGRIDFGPHRDRRRDTDAEMAIGPANRYRQASQGKAQDAPGRARAPQTIPGPWGPIDLPIGKGVARRLFGPNEQNFGPN